MMDKSMTLGLIMGKVEQLDKLGMKKIAAFDLDNTLLIGDIGDAVFAQLLLENRDLPLSWGQYMDLVRAGKKLEAYTGVVTAMAGISVQDLEETTAKILDSQEPFLQINGDRVPVPKPNPMMQELLKQLKQREYGIYVISATNVYSVRVAAARFFDLPQENVFGIQPELEENSSILKDKLVPPITVVEGKAQLYRDKISSSPPLITGGDSSTDLPMLNLTHPGGLVIWVDKSGNGAGKIEEKLDNPGALFVVSP